MNQRKLWHRDFTLVIIGQIISLFGNAVLRFALPLYLLHQTQSSSLYGIVTACSFLPMVVLSLVGGVLADRVNKRNIMVALDFFTMLIILITGLLVLNHFPIVPLCIAALMLLYSISGVYQPAVQASIPVLANEDQLITANAIVNQIGTLSGLLGPVLGGVAYSAWGITPVLWMSAACFGFSAVMEIFIHIPHVPVKADQSALKLAMADLRESYRFIRDEQPLFIHVAAIASGFNLVLSAVLMVGVPVLIVQVLALPDTSLGVMQGMQALGGLAGGGIAMWAGNRLNLKRAHGLLAVCAASVLVIGLVLLLKLPPALCGVVITAMIFISMAAATLFAVQVYAIVQRHTPSRLLGKVMAVLLAVSMCAQPIGQAIYGFLFEWAGSNAWMVMTGAALIAFLMTVYAGRILSRVSSPDGAPHPTETQRA